MKRLLSICLLLAGSTLFAQEKTDSLRVVTESLRTMFDTKDIPVLQGAVLLVGIVYMLSTLLADLLIAYLNPRVRLEATR